MQFPRIHLNGSHGQTLLDQYIAAINAVDDAMKALRSIDINGRDYYVISPSAAQQAITEQSHRIGHLVNIKNDLELIAENIGEQIG